MHGRGKFTCERGTYQGEFFGSFMHGTGRFDFKEGGSYYGEFIEGKRTGHGVLCYGENSVYEGHFQDDVRHGFGSMEFDNGEFVCENVCLCVRMSACV
jgi:hypothetical protein